MFSGNLVAIVTPMRADGSLDFAAWARLLDFHLDNGSNGIVVGGSTGESATVTDEELCELVKQAAARVRGRVPLIIGAGSSSTAVTVTRTQLFSTLPVDALLVVTPAYVRPTQEGLYRHYCAVAEASRVPILVYNVPVRTAVDILPATVGRLAKVPGIKGIKEAVAEVSRIRELIAACGPDFAVLSGDDPTAREAIQAGAHGVISVTSNVVPRAMSDMVAAALRGDRAAAERIDARIAGLHRDLFVEPNPIPAKWALVRMGLIDKGIRLPLTELSAAGQATVTAALRAAEVIQ